MFSNFTLSRMRPVLTETSLIWTISLLKLIWKARHLKLFEFRRINYWILFLQHCFKALIPRTFFGGIYCSSCSMLMLTLAFRHALEILRGLYELMIQSMCYILNSAKRSWTVWTNDTLYHKIFNMMIWKWRGRSVAKIQWLFMALFLLELDLGP